MLIPNSDIKNWQDLQDQVASLFREMGYIAHTPHKLALVSGSKEVDIFVEDPRHSISHEIIVECKHWVRPVPQEVVHALRSVVEDSGTNTGIIVSSAGFQSGAGDAAMSSNIQLMTWEGLQRSYGYEWYLRQIESIQPLWALAAENERGYLDQPSWSRPRT